MINSYSLRTTKRHDNAVDTIQTIRDLAFTLNYRQRGGDLRTKHTGAQCYRSCRAKLCMTSHVTAFAFKYAVLVYKCLHGSAPAYLTDELCQVADVEARQRLRSSSSSSLIVSRTRLSTVGDRAVPVAAARVWNSLPDLVTSAPSVAVFRSRLKTHLFNISYPSPL